MPGYAVQRFFFHASLHVFFAGLFAAFFFLVDGLYWWASISAAVAATCFVYRRAFYESRDVRRGVTTPPKSDPESS